MSGSSGGMVPSRPGLHYEHGGRHRSRSFVQHDVVASICRGCSGCFHSLRSLRRGPSAFVVSGCNPRSELRLGVYLDETDQEVPCVRSASLLPDSEMCADWLVSRGRPRAPVPLE